MLNKKNRIQRKTFPLLSSGSRFSKSDVFLFRYLENQEKNKKFCFSISKKIAKKAVIRNKMRRWGYLELGVFIKNIKEGIIAVFVFKKIPKDRVEVGENIRYLLNKNKLIT